MYCKNCGSEVNQNDKFCPSCGCQITEEVSPVNGDPIDSKSEVNKKSSGLKKSSKIIIASVLAVVLLSGIAAAGIRLGIKMANKPAENGGSASALDSDDVSSQNGSQSSNKIRTFNSLLEDDNYWVPVKIEHFKHYNDNPEMDSNTTLNYDWYENAVKIKEEIAYRQNSQYSSITVTFDNNGKIQSETFNNETYGSITTNYEYTNDLLSKISDEYDYMDISRDSKGKITKFEYVEFKYNSENECSICVNGSSNPLYVTYYKYDNNDGINLNLSDFEILDKEWAEDDGYFDEDGNARFSFEPYPVISIDLNDTGMITRFSMNRMAYDEEDNYLCKTTENGYYSEYKISYNYGYDTYKVYWELGTNAQERTGLYRVFTDVILDFIGEDTSYIPLRYLSYLFAAGESVF